MMSIEFDQYYPGNSKQMIASGLLSRGYNNIADHNRRVMWVMIPKNANTSIKQAIGIRNKKRHNLELVYDVREYDYRKVAFIRNPFDRFESCYKWAFVGNKELFRTFPQYESVGVRANMRFDRWVEVVCEHIDDSIADKHFRSQSARISDAGGVDFIGCVETIDEDWHRLRKEFSIKIPSLPKEKHNQSGGAVQWTKRLRNLIRARYEDDFRLWNENCCK